MKLNLKNARKIKTLKGFGGSAAWWSQNIDDDKTARDVAELLYGESGLKMNIYRYNVGGGYDENNVRVENKWRLTQSFMNEDGTYDFCRDKNAVRMMRYALDTGNVDTLIFFVNSPHYSHTVSGQASGGLTAHFSNLRKDKYRAFAKYLIDIAEHFISEGYPVKYISPINEPQWKWGGDKVWQEGCHYEPKEVRDCFRAFCEELEERRSPLLLYGPESGSIADHTKEYYRLLSQDDLIMKYLDVFAYHSYWSDNNALEKAMFGKWAKKNIKTPRLDMSEWCELPCKHDTKSIKSALINARIIGEDLILSKVDSWTAWVCVNQDDGAKRNGKSYSDGLLSAKDDFSNYYIAMRYYAMAHFSKFIQSGSVSLNAGFKASLGFSAFAFKNADGKYTVVAVNNSKRSRTLEPDIDFKSVDVYTTSEASQLQKSISKGKKITVAPMTLATIIFND